MIDSLAYWTALVAAGVLCAAIPAGAERWRAGLLAVVSVLVLKLTLFTDNTPLLLVVGAAVWVSIAARITQRHLVGKSALGPLLLLAPLLCMWMLGKLAVAGGDARLRLFYFVGFSYLLVKAWTLLRDAQAGRIPAPVDQLLVLSYLLHFPTFALGPMHLFGEYAAAVRERTTLSLERALDATFRIALGLVKVKLLAPMLTPLSLQAIAENDTAVGVPQLLLASVVYSLLIYLDFSGYTDVAVASSRLLGVQAPENFARPYLALNLREFWQRWHISFTRVLTSYVFVPLSRALERWTGDRPRTVMASCYVVTFLVCGYWHGATPNFLVWGAYHALGLIAVDLYRPIAAKRRRQRGGKAGVPRAIGNAVAMTATFAFVSVGWVFFALPLSRVL